MHFRVREQKDFDMKRLMAMVASAILLVSCGPSPKTEPIVEMQPLVADMAEWKGVGNDECTLSTGGHLLISAYLHKTTDADAEGMLVLFKKDGVLVVQAMTRSGGGGIAQALVKNKVLTFDILKKEDVEKANAVMYEALGITQEQFDNCK